MRRIQPVLLILLASVLLSGCSAEHGALSSREATFAWTGPDGTLLQADAGRPAGKGPFPVAILVHGGGWTSGDRRGPIRTLAKPLAEAGFVWFSVEYRLAPQSRWPAPVDDVLSAVAFARSKAPALSGDTSRVALIGYSAGGHLATWAVLRGARVQALVGIAPPTDFEQDLEARGGLSPSLQALLDRPKEVTDESLALLRAVSPIHAVHSGLPPVLLIHGTKDRSVPVAQSRAFADTLRAAGVPVTLAEIEGAPHRLADWDQFNSGFRKTIIYWLQAQLSAE